jgi:hypothetical protein
MGLATKREAFHLSLAIEALIYGYPERVIMAGFVALAACFQNLVEHAEMQDDALTLFSKVLREVTDPEFALEEDDPAVRGYVLPPHETVQ